MRKGNGILTKIIDFVEAKGFYIVLILCALAVGVSGYVLLFSGGDKEEEITVTVAATTTTSRPTLRSTKPTEKTMPPTTTVPDTPATTTVKISGKTDIPHEVANPVNIRQYMSPVKGDIVRGFSKGDLVYDDTMADWRTHNGVDFACPEGTEVKAISDGTVISAIRDELRGGTVVIEHAGGIVSTYCGLGGSGEVKTGQSVDAGQVIGYTAANIKTESMLQPHLHLEITKEGLFIDPAELGID